MDEGARLGVREGSLLGEFDGWSDGCLGFDGLEDRVGALDNVGELDFEG